MIDEKQLQEWRKLADEATPGEWVKGNGTPPFYDGDETVRCKNYDWTGHERVLLQLNSHFPVKADALFIAAARTAVPQLLDEIARLNARVAELEAWVNATNPWREETVSDFTPPECDHSQVVSTRFCVGCGKDMEIEIPYENATSANNITQEYISDGFGNYWLKDCPNCGAPMQVVRPGFARCSAECYIKNSLPEIGTPGSTNQT